MTNNELNELSPVPTAPPVISVVKGALSRLPQISLVALLLTAIFNVGFYSEVGLHFIGTMDFTNFIYSFALVFSVLLGFTQSFFFLTGEFLAFASQPHVAWPKMRYWLAIYAALIIVVFLAGALAPRKYVPEIFLFANPWGEVTLFTGFTIIQLMASYVWYKGEVFTWADLGYSLFPVFFAVFWWGKATAYSQVFSSQRYTLTTHQSVLNGASLVRTSPAGFLISVDGTIMFFPISEIRSVIAEAQIKP